MDNELMHLRILLPCTVFSERRDVRRIVIETPGGSCGLLPHRLDCVAALCPGILTYETAEGETVYVAVNEGVMVKTGLAVMVSVRYAIGGTDLGHLRQAVEQDFRRLDEHGQHIRTAMARLESSFMRRLAEFRHE
ncbi:MAG TPA: F0F1 ATP synthase subunit epsilon [Deltaproteobacteria bacterium]|nr:F0F1 ATP synthase subunit epsilon [Deltaproteobacteria bacterium]HQB38771.1 F0F1 ATP synthase subunit epsilon [Deltaproteobacteria bacterium]